MSYSRLTPRKDSARSTSTLSSRSISIRSVKSSVVNSPREQGKSSSTPVKREEPEIVERPTSRIGEDKLAFDKSLKTPLSDTSKEDDKKEEESNEIVTQTIKNEAEIDQGEKERIEREDEIRETILNDLKDLGITSLAADDEEDKRDAEKSETNELLSAVAEANKLSDAYNEKNENFNSSDENNYADDKIDEEKEKVDESSNSPPSEGEDTDEDKKSVHNKRVKGDDPAKKKPTRYLRKYPSNRGKKVLRTVVTLMTLTKKKQPKFYRTYKSSDGSYSDSYKSYKMHKFKETKSLSSDLYMSKLLLENTYKMEPDTVFPQFKIEKLILSVLEESLRTMTYDGIHMGKVTKMITEVLKEKVKSMRLERYRIITWVVISQKDKGDLRIVSRGLLDQKTDNYATAVFENSTLEEEGEKENEEEGLRLLEKLIEADYFQTSSDKKNLEDNDIFLLFFFDQFSLPCQTFLPMLIEFYKEGKLRKIRMEIIAVPCNEDIESCRKEYVKNHEKWLFLNCKSIVESLIEFHQVFFIPKVIVISRKGSVITRNGRKGIENIGISVFYQWLESHRHTQLIRRISRIPKIRFTISIETRQKSEKFKRRMRKAKLFNLYSTDYTERQVPDSRQVDINLAKN
ncbi:DgyrCDS8264 [Dimorphilus gyrociliatus]|uniref:DgyrCDS8264 n=1 Tax=Dimorphilus gyrociliatus TaxID=2664684 RepID=A0A7I8VVC6_9ANNE|nr:DgyrCDS8264 [Dimorphilus gyrociliatus]